MIDFYLAATPNAHKVTIMLEELGLVYKPHFVNLASQEQKTPAFLAMNPNGRIPVIVDHEGVGGKKQTVFESGAILYYLAEKANGKFLGENLPEKTQVMEWLMFQMSGIGPMFGNYYYGCHFMQPKNDQYIERFEKESKRLLSVMEIQLQKSSYLAGENYSIADMATFPWVQAFYKANANWFESTPQVCRWIDQISERPAVKRALS